MISVWSCPLLLTVLPYIVGAQLLLDSFLLVVSVRKFKQFQYFYIILITINTYVLYFDKLIEYFIILYVLL